MKGELVHAGLSAPQVQVVPPFVYGLPLAVDADPAEPPCVLFVGRVVDAKGVRDVLAAWQRSGVELPLRLAGTGTLRGELEAAGAEVLGWVDRPRLAALYRSARVVVLPSRWQEPFGIVGLEALRAGVPVAAWRSGGVAEWHPGGPGLVEWGDVDGLARAIAELADQRAEPAAGFEQAPIIDKLRETYRKLCQ